MAKPLEVFRSDVCGVSYDGTHLPGACGKPQGHNSEHGNFTPLPHIDGLNGWTPCLTNFTDPTGCLRVCWRPSGHVAFASDCATHWGPTYTANLCGTTLAGKGSENPLRCNDPFGHEGLHAIGPLTPITTLPEDIHPKDIPPNPAEGPTTNRCPSALSLHGTAIPCEYPEGHTGFAHANTNAGAIWTRDTATFTAQ